MTKRKTRTKTTTGVSRRRIVASLIPFAAAVAAESYAVIGGTVFRDPGFALPKAEVLLGVLEPPAVKKKPKEQKILSDGRGEFAFRVPASPAKYRLTVSAPGFATQEKEVAIAGDERVDSYFQLKPAGQ